MKPSVPPWQPCGEDPPEQTPCRHVQQRCVQGKVELGPCASRSHCMCWPYILRRQRYMALVGALMQGRGHQGVRLTRLHASIVLAISSGSNQFQCKWILRLPESLVGLKDSITFRLHHSRDRYKPVMEWKDVSGRRNAYSTCFVTNICTGFAGLMN